MKTLTITQPGQQIPLQKKPSENIWLKKALLFCGIASSILYVVMNIVCAMLYEGYSSFTQTVSELSAVDAPTRPLWVPLGIIYTLLVALFGWGIWQSARTNRRLRVIGILMIAYGLIGLFWPPMHQRTVLAAGGGTLTDTLHIVFSIVSVSFMLIAIGIGAAAFGKKFRIYSIVTLLVLLFYGALTGFYAPALEANLPTPWLGVWERISIGGFLLWVIVLSIMLLRSDHKKPSATANN